MYPVVKAAVQRFISKLKRETIQNQGNTPYFLVTVASEVKGVVTEESFGGFVVKLTTSDNIDYIAAKAHQLTAMALDQFAKSRALVAIDETLGESHVIYHSSNNVIVVTIIANPFNSEYLSDEILKVIKKELT